MKANHPLYKLYKLLFVVLIAGVSTSCSLMHETLEPCPSGIYVRFVYDYNIQRADMFKDHVGGVTLYLFDQNGKFIYQQEENNNSLYAPLKEYDYKMHLDLPAGAYQLIALAQQQSYNATLETNRAKFLRAELQQGDDIASLLVQLEHTDGEVLHNNLPLDTLWHGMTTQTINVVEMGATYDTINLVRNTNTLIVSLHQLDDPTDIESEDFEIRVIDNNGTLTHDNNPMDDELICYTPYTTWTTDFRDEVGNIVERTAHAAIRVSRLIHYPISENSKNALLSIYNKRTELEVARINLPDCLAQGRGAFEYYNYTPQEFLDREYSYRLHFFLKGDSWQYVDLGISILSWSKRIQKIEF